MTENPYAAFLPPERRRAATLAPEATWWTWGDHEVHIARARRPQASTRVLVVHGAGGRSGALWPLTALLAEDGFDVAALDLPLYGHTTSLDPREVRYEDWIMLLSDRRRE